MHGEVVPGWHLSLCDFFKTLLHLLDLFFGVVSVPRGKIEFRSALMEARCDYTMGTPFRWNGNRNKHVVGYFSLPEGWGYQLLLVDCFDLREQVG